MKSHSQGKRRFGATTIAFLLVVMGWLPAVAAKVDRYYRGPGEYMELDMALPMIALGGCSLLGIGCALYGGNRAEAEGRPIVLPFVAGVLHIVGPFVFLSWFL